jgi:hypothetical protein
LHVGRKLNGPGLVMAREETGLNRLRARSRNPPERPSAIGSCKQEARRRKLAERFATRSAA